MRLRDVTMAACYTPLAGRFVLGGELEMKIGEICVNLWSYFPCSARSGEPQKNMGACEFRQQTDSRYHGDIVHCFPFA